jgi:hypothetical protein
MIGWANLSLDDKIDVRVVPEDTDVPFRLYLGADTTFTGFAMMFTKEMFESLIFQCQSALHEYDQLQLS